MLTKNLYEFVQLLNGHDVKYMVVGGHAVGLYGHPRYTGDLDIFVGVSQENADRICEVFREFGFPNTVEPANFLEPNINAAIGEPPQRIHLLTGIAGVAFEDCYPKAMTVESDGLKLKVIGIDDLIKSKQALMRDQDVIDLKSLERAREMLRERGEGRER